MRLKLIAGLSALLFGAAAPAADSLIPYEKFQLDNGLTVIVHQDTKAPVIAVSSWLRHPTRLKSPAATIGVPSARSSCHSTLSLSPFR